MKPKTRVWVLALYFGLCVSRTGPKQCWRHTSREIKSSLKKISGGASSNNNANTQGERLTNGTRQRALRGPRHPRAAGALVLGLLSRLGHVGDTIEGGRRWLYLDLRARRRLLRRRRGHVPAPVPRGAVWALEEAEAPARRKVRDVGSVARVAALTREHRLRMAIPIESNRLPSRTPAFGWVWLELVTPVDGVVVVPDYGAVHTLLLVVAGCVAGGVPARRTGRALTHPSSYAWAPPQGPL